MTSISTSVLMLILTFVLTTISIYNGTGCFLRISDFCIPNSKLSELRIPIFEFRNSERLDLQMFGLWLLDF